MTENDLENPRQALNLVAFEDVFQAKVFSPIMREHNKINGLEMRLVAPILPEGFYDNPLK